MLESLTIQNFQKHEALKVEFSPTITTIIGSTDAGKSALLRALRWACLNQPQGDGFKKVGTEEVQCKIHADDFVVRRTRSPSENLYELNGSRLKPGGSGVPEPIQKALNVGPINFQGQHDASFWFSLTAGEVSRELNTVVDLEIIDQSLSYVVKNTNSSKAAAEVHQKSLQEAKKRKSELEWVDGASEDFRKVKVAKYELDKQREAVADLSGLVEVVRRNTDQINRIEQYLQDAAVVGTAGKRMIEQGERAKSLRDAVTRLQEIEHHANQEIPDMSELEDLHDRMVAVKRTCFNLAASIEALEEATEDCKRCQDALNVAVKKYQELVGQECPLCGKPMPDAEGDHCQKS